MAMRTSNPTLSTDTFKGLQGIAATDPMTVQGTVNKTGILLLCVMATAAWTWNRVSHGGVQDIAPAIMVGSLVGFITALVTIYKQNWAPYTAPVYALMEGLVIGGLSSLLELRYPGIAMQAAGLTFGTLFCLLLAYSSGVIRATENFKMGVVAATGGIALVYLVSMVLGIFGHTIPFIHDSGIVGIGFSLFVVAIAAMNLVLDFDFIESGAKVGAPKHMEWYGAFSLLVTLVWLYIEVLRLLAKARGRR